MKQKYLDNIRKACIKANPEIVELKFGCEVHCKDYKEFLHTYRTYAGRKYNKKQDRSISQVIDSSGDLFPLDKNYEIIGRQIQLADVLMAITENYKKENNGIDDALRTDHIDILDEWNLKETMENQSLPTLKFISELL